MGIKINFRTRGLSDSWEDTENIIPADMSKIENVQVVAILSSEFVF